MDSDATTFALSSNSILLLWPFCLFCSRANFQIFFLRCEWKVSNCYIFWNLQFTFYCGKFRNVHTNTLPFQFAPHPVEHNCWDVDTLDRRIQKVQHEGKRGGGRLFFPQIETNWPLPYLKDAGPASTVQCREPKTRQQKVQFYYEDEIHCRSGYSLSMLWTVYCTWWNLLYCTW